MGGNKLISFDICNSAVEKCLSPILGRSYMAGPDHVLDSFFFFLNNKLKIVELICVISI